jgi:glycosyltransferase involved in cell wall biosynthesis
MRILIVSQYFWPEYFRINDLALELSKTHAVEVLTGEPNYPNGDIFPNFKTNKKNFDYLEKIKIYRVPIFPRRSGSKLFLTINYLSFLLSSIFYGSFLLRKKKYDIIVTFATSPIIVALISIFLTKLKKSKHILWLLDLWPVVLHDLKIINKNSFLFKLLNKLVNYIYKNSDLILCQSLAFKKEIKNNLDKIFYKKIIYFPSWPEETLKNSSNDKFSYNQEVVFDKNFTNILFTGNIGQSQNFDLVLRLFKYFDLKKNKIKLYIAGQGREYLNLSSYLYKNDIKNIVLMGWVPFNLLQSYFINANFLLISLGYKETFDKTIPGKFQTYLKYKKPIVGLLGGETNKIINKYKIGKAFDFQEEKKLFRDVDNYLSNKIKIEDKNFDLLLNIYSKSRRVKKFNFYINNISNFSSLVSLRLLLNPNHINYHKKFIVSALNLAFLGYYAKRALPINDYLFLWPDGYFRKRFVSSYIKKTPGRELLKSLKFDNSIIKKIIVIGNLEKKSKSYLENMFKLKVKHIQLPYGNLNDFKIHLPTFKKDEVCFLTLPTPKQEILADYIAVNQSYCKIFCLGGAINMASGVEKSVPDKFAKIFFAEALWRLQFDTTRRLTRFVESFFYYLMGEIKREYKNINIRVLNEKF